MLYKYVLTGGFICAYLRCRWGTDSAQCRPKVFGVWTLVGPWNHFWWRPRSRQGKVQFFGGSSKHDDVGPTSERDVGPTSRFDVGPTSLADVGPTPRRIGPTSARCRADEQTTSIRRRADVNYRYVADVVLTSARRRRVYWDYRTLNVPTCNMLGPIAPLDERG